jgi:hypothetical protein
LAASGPTSVAMNAKQILAALFFACAIAALVVMVMQPV